MESPQERRREPRVTLFELGIREPDSDEPIGILLDISLSGCCTVCRGKLVVGSRHRIRLELPRREEQRVYCDLEAEVRWIRDSMLPPCTLVGWEFSGVMPLEVSQLIGDLVCATR